MDKYRRYFTNSCVTILQEFVEKILYLDVIENQQDYFKAENMIVIDGVEHLSTRNMSLRVILLWVKFIYETAHIRALINSIAKFVGPVTGFSVSDIQTMMLETLSQQTYEFKVKIPEGEYSIPVAVQFDFDSVITQIKDAINPV